MSDVVNVESPEDEALLVELRALVSQVDPVPENAVLAARSALAYRTLDADLAELTADSAVDEQRSTPVRAVDKPMMLTFRALGLTLEIEVLVDGRRRRLLGQLMPAQPGRVEVRHRDGCAQVGVDEVGRFAMVGLPPGPVSLRCQVAGSRAVETDWFLA